MTLRFEEAIPKALELLTTRLGGDRAFARAHIVRDTAGSVVVVLPDNALPQTDWDEFAQLLDTSLRPYSAGAQRVLLREGDLIDPDDVLASPDKTRLEVPNAWLIDRLLTNQDWVRDPLRRTPRVPTAVAYSIKGGVGRSTAFAMFAWYLARKGQNVMVVDLDLEAPGIGNLLLSELPMYGSVDWLTEDMASSTDAASLEASIGEAELAQETPGRIRVLPAYGQGSTSYISKLGRVYAPSIDDTGNLVGLAERLDNLLAALAAINDPPDVVLLDSRAGLHDIGSAAVTRLGAEVFLFARNDVQDWWAYKQLFKHLRCSRSATLGMGNDNDLRWNLKMVAAQTPPNDADRREWTQASYDTWNGFYDDETVEATEGFIPQVFARDDLEAPHNPLFINFDIQIRSLTLKDASSRPDWDFVAGCFGNFFDRAERQLLASTAMPEESQ